MPPSRKKATRKKTARKKTTAKRGRGRPTVWTPEVEEKLAEALDLGISRRKSAMIAGIAWNTFLNRMNSDPDFLRQVGEWEGGGIIHHAKRLKSASRATHLRAAEFYLRTHDRQGFGDAPPDDEADSRKGLQITIRDATPPPPKEPEE